MIKRLILVALVCSFCSEETPSQKRNKKGNETTAAPSTVAQQGRTIALSVPLMATLSTLNPDIVPSASPKASPKVSPKASSADLANAENQTVSLLGFYLPPTNIDYLSASRDRLRPITFYSENDDRTIGHAEVAIEGDAFRNGNFSIAIDANVAVPMLLEISVSGSPVLRTVSNASDTITLSLASTLATTFVENKGIPQVDTANMTSFDRIGSLMAEFEAKHQQRFASGADLNLVRAVDFLHYIVKAEILNDASLQKQIASGVQGIKDDITLAIKTIDETTETAGIIANTANDHFAAMASVHNSESTARIQEMLALVSAADQNETRDLITQTQTTLEHPSDSNAVMPSDFVLGQINATTTTTTPVSASSMNNPQFVSSDGVRLFVIDQGNNRILIWKTLPTSNNQPADIVLGQAAFTSGNTRADPNVTWAGPGPPPPFVSAISFNQPRSLCSNGKQLFVADARNNRILMWHNIPTQSDVPADIVLGQSEFSSADAGTLGTPSSTTLPTSLSCDATHLVVSEEGRTGAFDRPIDNVGRIMIWNAIPTTNNQAADLFIGNSAAGNDPTDRRFRLAPQLYFDGIQLFALEGIILTWNGWPTENQQAQATAVDLKKLDPLTPANGIKPFSDGNRFILNGQNRVLMWKQQPIPLGQAPDQIFGQVDSSSITANAGGLSIDSLNTPMSVFVVNDVIYIADSANHRIVVHKLK